MYLYICYQSLGMQFSYPKNKGVMNKIKDGLLKESLFNILSQKKEIICFVLLIKYVLLFLFQKSVGKSNNNTNSLDFWMTLAINSLDFWIKYVSLL